MKILVVEDETKVAKAIGESLEAERYEVKVAGTGEEGFFLVETEEFDLVVLDLMLPGRSGLEILKALRQKTSRVPVLILTALDSIQDRVTGLDAGADDYLVKPFAFTELSARIRALTRRSRPEAATRLKVNDLELDSNTRKVSRAGKDISLTPKEFSLLEYLMRHEGIVVTRDMLARDVWRITARATPLDNVIDVHVARLRRKIDEPFETALIRTVRGVGHLIGAEAP
jgi:two-component system, OmpR family, copper resistance phosphate regulon response regulator CusR